MSKSLALAFLVAAAAPARAQSVLFHEDFEDGIVGWTRTGYWNAESATDPCGAWAAPYPSGTGAAYYGNDAVCNYVTGPGPGVGTLSWDTWIDLPAATGSILLRFWSASETEYCLGNWDRHELWIDVENGASVLFPLCTTWWGQVAVRDWHEVRADLTSLAGARIRPRFRFDVVDNEENQYVGWFLDDVSIVVEPGVRVCPSTGFTPGCPCPPSPSAPPIAVAGGCLNSTGQSAVLASSGAPVVSGDTLALLAREMPPNATCLLVQAAGSGNAVHFGDGVRCVSGSVIRMGAQAASNGVASWPPTGTDSIAVRGGVPAGGGTRYYYVYYRDVLSHCTSATFNLTDTQRIVWTP